MAPKSSVVHTVGKVALSATLGVATFATAVYADGFDNGSRDMNYDSSGVALPSEGGRQSSMGSSVGLNGSGQSSSHFSSASGAGTGGGAAGSEVAGGERRSAALAHYARARTMLLESLAEFERARDIARPDLFIDSEQWRNNVINRAQDLDHVLNPRPREVAGGVQLSSQPTLIRGESPEEKKSEIHGKLSDVHTPVGARSVAVEGRGRLISPKKTQVIKLKAPKTESVKIKTESLSTMKDSESSAAVEVEAPQAAAMVREKSEKTTVSIERSAPVKSTQKTQVEITSDNFPVTIEKSEAPVAAAQAAPAPEVKALDEAELRKRLKKLADEVQAREQTSGSAEEAPIGGMSGQ